MIAAPFIRRVIAQGLYDLSGPALSGIPKRAWIRDRANRWRLSMVRAGFDPLVRYARLGIEVPLSHPIGYFQGLWPEYNKPAARIARALFAEDPRVRVIDLGANVGDTAAEIRLQAPVPVLCVEGEEKTFEILARNFMNVPDVHPVLRLVAQKDGPLPGEWILHAGNAVFAEARPSAVAPAPRHAASLDTLVAGFPEFADARLLKVDIEGFDLAVLRGAIRWLRRAQPVILMEYNRALLKERSETEESFDRLVDEIGYTTIQIYEAGGRLEETFEFADSGSVNRVRERARVEDVFDIAIWPARRTIDPYTAFTSMPA